MPVTWLLDAGFDDIAVWNMVWAQGHTLVCRVQHRDRLVHPTADATAGHLSACAARLHPLARSETEMVVRKHGQRREKLQPVTVVVSACPFVLRYTHAPDALPR